MFYKEQQNLNWKSNQAERNGGRADISQVDFSWSKSLLWDSSWSSEHFYGNFIERDAKKAFSSELFNSTIAEFKENIQFKEKKSKNFKAKKKETKSVAEVKAFTRKTL